MRTRAGRVFTGVNLDAYLGRMAVCAEAVALGQVVTDLGDTGIDTIVAVRHPQPARGRPDHRGGVALRRLPRTDLGLRPQRARDRAGQRTARPSSPSANCCRTNTAGKGRMSAQTPRDAVLSPPARRAIAMVIAFAAAAPAVDAVAYLGVYAIAKRVLLGRGKS